MLTVNISRPHFTDNAVVFWCFLCATVSLFLLLLFSKRISNIKRVVKHDLQRVAMTLKNESVLGKYPQESPASDQSITLTYKKE